MNSGEENIAFSKTLTIYSSDCKKEIVFARTALNSVKLTLGAGFCRILSIELLFIIGKLPLGQGYKKLLKTLLFVEGSQINSDSSKRSDFWKELN